MTLYSFGNASPPQYQLVPTHWINGTLLSQNFPAPYTNQGGDEIPREAIGVSVAANVFAAPAEQMVVLDAECIRKWDELLMSAQIARAMRPDGLLSCFGILPTGNAEEWLRADKDAAHPIHATMRQQRPLIDLLSHAMLSAYLLWPGKIDYEVSIFAAMRRLYRRHYPKLKLIWNIWGTYHTNWSPEAPLSADVAAKYAKAFRRDDVIVFDSKAPRDDGLMGAF